MRDLCVFDLDGTLISYDSFGRLVRRHALTSPALFAAGIARKTGIIGPARFAELAHARLMRFNDCDTWGRYASEIAGDILPDRRSRIAQWRERGAYLVLLSASPHDYVALAGTALGFDAAHGSQMTETGYLHLHGPAKRAFIDRHYPPSDWRRAFAIADSDSDAALLEAFEIGERV